jgi:hypothetical protein
MTTSGAAPAAAGSNGWSVMAAFPLAPAVDTIVHGTANHWTSQQPLEQNPAYFPPPIFRATHNFLIAQIGSQPVAVVYHPEVPAWSFTDTGVLIGCLLRNTPGVQGRHGASASDTATHVLHYALRTPRNLGDPSTGQPLAEALNYNMPAVATLIPSTSSQQLPESFSIAGISQGTGAILAAKPSNVTAGSLILRLYQPNITPQNQPQSLSVSLGSGQPSAVVAVTALEDQIMTGGPTVTPTGTGFTISASTAMNTVQVTRSSLSRV